MMLPVCLVLLGTFAWLGWRYVPQSVEARVESIEKQCRVSPLHQEQCFARELEKEAILYGRDEAISVLVGLRGRGVSEYSCHFVAHGIGWGLYKRDPDGWRDAAIADTGECNYGVFHGILEYYVAQLPRDAQVPEQIASICNQKPNTDCQHAVGHVFLVMRQGDRERALTDCDTYQVSFERLRCYSGVFMEVMTGFMLVEHTLADASYLQWGNRMEEFEAICRQYSEDHAVMCWQAITHPATVVFVGNPKRVFDLCAAVPFDRAKDECMARAVSLMTVQANFDAERVRPACRVYPGDAEFMEKCYQYIEESIATR
jgi:hypothetical protein